MKNKRFLIIMLIFIVSIISISAVSAVEDSANDISANICIGDSNNPEQILEENIQEVDSSISDCGEISLGDSENIVSDLGENVDLKGDVLKSGDGSTGTFLDLNDAINNNAYTEITLGGNYAYSSGDDSFKNGIQINRELTIFGNGFTINGNNKARIFNVSSNKVILRDIVFENGNTTGYGGAIFGDCTVINCTFNNNYAYSGGAMYNGNAISCNFTNNSAGDTGGALYNVAASNCILKNNSAMLGGAMGYNIASNCIFINNSATYHGGALYVANAENCVFIDNKADTGGGISAGMDGNANAINCNFTNNTAREGGACYQAIAKNCRFEENHASVSGGAMFKGSAENCIFINNNADSNGNDTYETTFKKPLLKVSNFASTYNSGAKFIFNLTDTSGMPINDANIAIKVYKGNALLDTYYALSGNGWLVNLNPGTYLAVFSIENQGYDVDPVNATLTISKANIKIISADVSTVYGINKYLVITLKDNKGKLLSAVPVSINLNGVKSLKTDKNGQIKLPIGSLVPKTYAATITFLGDSFYYKLTKSVKVTVNKAKVKLIAKAKSFKLKVKVKKYSIILKNNRNQVMKNTKLTLRVNKKTFTAKTNGKGVATFKISNLKKKAKFKAVIKYAGNRYYSKLTKKVVISVKK